jgi:hypothetical protein
MKQILGDNQFFGVNHNDLDKGAKTKGLFSDNNTVELFIRDSITIGLCGFMINSNLRGYQIVDSISNNIDCEIHYSVPYPHKFASMVNEGGMLAMLNYVLSKSSLRSLFFRIPRFLFTGNLKYIMRLIVELEIPKNLPKGSFVYLQNIVTDLLIGIGRYDLLDTFCRIVIRMGYNPGLITLNPLLLDKVICSFDLDIQRQLIVCFNINDCGFNTFPSLEKVENFISAHHEYKKMGMSILASGGASSIEQSLTYIKKLPLDYVVYGSSSLNNIKANYNLLSNA